MRIKNIGDHYYLVAPEGVTLEQILRAIFYNTGMRKDSFADREVKRFFSDLFGSAMNLKAVYDKYYVKEYDFFRDFLYQKKNIEYEEIASLELNEGDTLWKLRYEINDYGVQNLIGYSGENLPLLNHFLEEIQL